ncbi:SCO family protein [Pseudalkalibacillus hwajinpoensis]|uniref:SCO family protein n=1 Tax=Guptibacillus hwajinpoensis TaxID=208199 RepID=UPI001CD4204D|nr:SCO family protein [Pseudalkalibacillus hwajinpoensis]MCA0993248.1 SCO family protein [Pseudalkalibacillus hwajinpoensis]
MKKRFLFVTGLMTLLVILAACGKDVPDDLDWEVQDFTYTDQTNSEFGLSDLDGKVWIADLIFTNCETVCPPMTANMSQLQDKLAGADVDVDLVSFSVDPKRDTPEELMKFSEKFDADLSNWHFLTGYDNEEIKRFAESSFKTAVDADPNSDQFIHGTAFYLVNKDGVVVKKYSGVSNVPYEEIVDDVKALQ